MGTYLYLVFLIFTISFGFIIFFGAPYLPTRRSQSKTALDLLDLKEGQVFYELGCGDGRVLLLAQGRGLRAVGYELNPILFCIAKLMTYKHKDIEVRFGNFWNADLSKADGVYVFLLDRFMTRLDKKLTAEVKKGAYLASYNFAIPGKDAKKKLNGIYLYRY